MVDEGEAAEVVVEDVVVEVTVVVDDVAVGEVAVVELRVAVDELVVLLVAKVVDELVVLLVAKVVVELEDVVDAEEVVDDVVDKLLLELELELTAVVEETTTLLVLVTAAGTSFLNKFAFHDPPHFAQISPGHLTSHSSSFTMIGVAVVLPHQHSLPYCTEPH